MELPVRYCTTEDDVTIAYAASGHGARCLLHTSNDLMASLQFADRAGRRDGFDALERYFTVVQYDSRGTGLSQRECENLTMDGLVDDLSAVADASGAEQFVLFGYLGGLYAATLYAAAHPQRVSHLVLWPAPFLDPRSSQSTSVGRLAVTDWETFTETYAHIALGWARGEQAHSYAQMMRETVSRETWLRFVGDWTQRYEELREEFEARAREVVVPTLVIQRSSYESFHRVAGLIPGSVTKMVDGDSVGAYVGEPEQVSAVVDAIAEFAGVPPSGRATGDLAAAPEVAGAAAIILFTDIAESTALTERMGDAAFRAAARALDDRVSLAMRGAGGRAVDGKVLGDGVMGVFTSAAQAIAAALECAEFGGELPMHIGLHAGDVISEGTNVYGGAVNIASRICGLCEPGEVLVSQTVRDLARTSAGVTFEDRGEHALKGIADSVRVFAVRRKS